MARGLIIDMDGVIYSGEELIPGADRFINQLVEERIPFAFVTNNSSQTPEQYVAKLFGLGMNVRADQIITSTDVAVANIKTFWPRSRVFVIGEDCIKEQLSKAGIEVVDADLEPTGVLIGETRTLNYQELCFAVRFVLDGAILLATNRDKLIPSVEGPIIGCGAITRCVEEASGRTARYFGKPSPLIARLAAVRLGISQENLIMIGDSLDTDIGLAANLGIPSVLVLSGLTERKDLVGHPFVPSKVVDSLADLIDYSWEDGLV